MRFCSPPGPYQMAVASGLPIASSARWIVPLLMLGECRM